MAKEINYAELHERLLCDDKHLALVNYIYKTQGTESSHLDYRAAASALGIDRKTVRNYVNDLTVKGVIVKRFNCKTWELRLADEILKEII